jgi:cytidine deaminase
MTEPIAAAVSDKAAQMQIQPNDILRLVQAARDVALRAYAPFSGYAVGAALLTDDGTIVGGCNVENSSYSLTVCAERGAACTAVGMDKRSFKAVAVVTRDGGAPCGACRQFLFEFNPDMAVILATPSEILSLNSLNELLPHGFRLAGQEA